MSDSEVLVKLMKQIDAVRKVALSDPNDGDPRMFSGRAMAKNQATTELEKLTKEYATVLPTMTAYFMLDGDPEKQQDFAALAEDEANAVAVDVNKVWDSIVDPAWKALGPQGQFQLGAYTLALNGVRKLLDEYRILYSRDFKFPGDKYCYSRDELLTLLRNTFYTQFGYTWFQLWINAAVAKECQDSGYTGSLVGVVVTNTTEEERTALGAVGYRTVKLPNSINKNSVIQTLKKALHLPNATTTTAMEESRKGELPAAKDTTELLDELNN